MGIETPYKSAFYVGHMSVLFVLDERGHKMSKSLGNVIDPWTVIEGGKNQKVCHCHLFDLMLSFNFTSFLNCIPTLGFLYRRHLDMEQMCYGFGSQALIIQVM
jgi:valyl-tRNA synthetase